jgi:hypothetical protein
MTIRFEDIGERGITRPLPIDRNGAAKGRTA